MMEQKTGVAVPIFSGDRADFEDWMFDVKLWISQTSKKPQDQAAAILLRQTDAQAKKVMRLCGFDELQGEGGVTMMLDAMKKKYGEDQSDLAWAKFEYFDGMRRSEGEDFANFARRFEVAYEDVVRYDKEVHLPERVLAMLLVGRMRLSKDQRMMMLTRVGDKATPVKVTRAAMQLMTKTEDDGGPTAVVKRELDDDGFFARGGNRTRGGDPKCYRCGRKGHIAKDCTVPFDKLPKTNTYLAEEEEAAKARPTAAANACFFGSDFMTTYYDRDGNVAEVVKEDDHEIGSRTRRNEDDDLDDDSGGDWSSGGTVYSHVS